MSVRRKLIREKVTGLLTTFDIEEAPVDVKRIADGLHIDVRAENVEGDISGFLFRNIENSKAIIGVNVRHHKHRQRFTVAHEIGHFLLHTGDKVHVDHGFEVRLRDDESSKGTDIDEKEANLFAAELLMPKEFIENDLAAFGTMDLLEEILIKDLAKKYAVSPYAFTFRLAYLGYTRL